MSAEIMIIAAHPDDAEIGMAGTIAACIAAKKKLVLVDLTNGEPTPFGSPEIRKQEWQAASAILGITERVNLGLSNRSLTDDISSRKALATVIRKYKPKVLFVPYWDDAHPDHLAASQLSVAARFYAKLHKWDITGDPHYPGKVFYYFCTHLRVQFQPSFVFDISAFIEPKLNSLRAYHSQFIANEKNQVVFEMVKTFNAYWGQQAGVAYAEPFICKEQLALSNIDVILSA